MAYEIKSSIATQVLETIPVKQNDQAFYTLIVHGDNQGFDSVTRYITLDLVKSISISSSSQITTYPLVTGDIMSDHKYDEPKSVSISGTFSLNGKFNDSFAFEGERTARLKNIQEYFEAVKKYGKLITFVCSADGARFSTIDNLVLTEIRFDLGVNSMNFSFSLKEVYFFSSASDIELMEDESDNDFPTLRDFEILDFSQEVLTKQNVTSLVINALNDNGLIEWSFAEFGADQLKTFFGVTGATLIVLLVGKVRNIAFATVASHITKSLGIAITTSSAVPVLGKIVIGIVIVVGAVALCKAFATWVKRLKMISEFRGYASKQAMNNEVNRFSRLISSVQDSFDKVCENNKIKCYGFTSNRDKQEMFLTIDDEIYQFDFERDSEGYWTMRISQTNGNEVETKNTSRMTGNPDILSLENHDSIFTGKNGTRLFLINKAIALNNADKDAIQNMLNDSWKEGTCNYLGYTVEEMADRDNPPSDLYERFMNGGIYKDLTDFVLVVTPLDTGEMKQKFNEAIGNALMK